MLFLFEYRAATLLIQSKFPGSAAASITKFELDNDVISLDGRDPLRTESELDDNGRTIRVRIRRSTSSAPDQSTLSPSIAITPRASNLSNAEIFSINTPVQLLPHDASFGHADLAIGYRSVSPRLSGYASSDAYSLQPTPRASNFNELETTTATTAANTPVWTRSPVAGRIFRQTSPTFSGVKLMWDSPGKSCTQGERQGYKDVVVAGTYPVLYWCVCCCRFYLREKNQADMKRFSDGVLHVLSPEAMNVFCINLTDQAGLRLIHLITN